MDIFRILGYNFQGLGFWVTQGFFMVLNPFLPLKNDSNTLTVRFLKNNKNQILEKNDCLGEIVTSVDNTSKNKKPHNLN